MSLHHCIPLLYWLTTLEQKSFNNKSLVQIFRKWTEKSFDPLDRELSHVTHKIWHVQWMRKLVNFTHFAIFRKPPHKVHQGSTTNQRRKCLRSIMMKMLLLSMSLLVAKKSLREGQIVDIWWVERSLFLVAKFQTFGKVATRVGFSCSQIFFF